MSEKIKEFVEIPQQFVREGTQVCASSYAYYSRLTSQVFDTLHQAFRQRFTIPCSICSITKHYSEFSQICKAVGVGFAVMGFIGYFVKLIHIPINNILVYAMLVISLRISLRPSNSGGA
ncbi:Protein transport protein Sec61 subunit gamma [Mycena indigotica]|uniref:Protein transport protein Sec61 subunit gamma n=1 Tax=Mycena indigotica TaxID=2126181 RepID=A0A8H6SZB8_9AGAR|nr:Protein transport protein Sec61 subunit gamma [Mycena indigotica]KAF7307062.1 Protein transport protein Sec61 subunit gamma [Mycena indigotica]